MTPRAYLNADELSKLTPWSPEAIRRMVARGVLRKGEHYFQPFGPRTQLLFKWPAIAALIENEPASPLRRTRNPGGSPDVAGCTAALQKLLA